MRLDRRHVGVFAVLACFAAPAMGQSITARGTTTEAYVGEPFRVQVIVSNPSTATTPAPGTSDACSIQLDQTVQNPTRSDFYQNINGRESRQVNYTYTFEVRASRVGVLTIPPFELNDGAHRMVSQPLQVTIKKPSSTPEMFCVVKAGNRKKVYVGEKVDLTLEIWVKKYRQDGSELDVRDTWQLLDERSMNLGVFAPGNNPSYREATRNDPSGKPVEYWVYNLESSAYPAKPGPLDLGNVTIAMQYPSRLARNVFGQLYHDRTPHNIRQQPTLPDLEVLALPTEGRPADFNGAVGTFSISASAKPTSVAVGDPITVTLSIRGSGQMTRLSPPRLNEVEGLKKDFEVSGESPAGEVEGGTKNFSITLRPLREDVPQIPPLPMSFFDPVQGKYQTAYSEAIAIQVRPAERLAVPSQSSGAGETQGTLAPLVESSEGLLANETNPERVLGSQAAAIGPGTWAMLAGWPVVYTGIWWTRRKALRLRSDDALRRRSRAYRTARGVLYAADGTLTPGQARAALVGYIADRCNAPREGMTRAEAVAVMQQRNAPAPTIAAVDGFLDQVEQAEYGGARASIGPQQAMELLDELERCKLR
ncbi:MAG TPA: BatD family protein [Phycisphaerae bacterium]|nr:BatD family protein [Phycisphaerae bacterium]